MANFSFPLSYIEYTECGLVDIKMLTVTLDLVAEEKLKDKLAHAAREKLAQTSKEKQIQAERKRKAAMFAAMLKSNQQPGGATLSQPPPATPDDESSLTETQDAQGRGILLLILL